MTRIPLSTVDEQARELSERLEMSTAEIGLSVRTTNCLEERGIFTVHDLLQCTRDDLLSHLEAPAFAAGELRAQVVAHVLQSILCDDLVRCSDTCGFRHAACLEHRQ